jgi:hypothetical protein
VKTNVTSRSTKLLKNAEKQPNDIPIKEFKTPEQEAK